MSFDTTNPRTKILDTAGTNELGVTSGNAAKTDMTSVAGQSTSVNNGTTDNGTQRVTLSSDSTGVVKLAAGTNVAAKVQVSDSGGVAAGTLSGANDGMSTSNVGLTGVNYNSVYNGTTWDRLRGDSTNGVYVNITTAKIPTATTMQNAATANGNGTNLSAAGYGTAIVSITASVGMSGGTTINFEASTDNTTFVAVQAINVGTNTIATTTTATGDWHVNIAGYSFLRARISAYSAGTITIKGWPITTSDVSPVVNANIVANSSTNQSVNVAQIAGTTTDTNSGNKSAGTQRIVLATDQPQLTNALKVDGSAVTQPVSASSLPLPTGAATSAKQPALGTAGSASSDVITVQGVTSMTALKVDGSGVTQPVSGTVTANAGTNLNTSALALETGGNLATLAGAITSTVMQSNVKQINGVTPLMGNGVTGTGSQRVTIASDNTAFSVNSTTVKSTAPASTTMQNGATGNGNGTNLSVAGYGTAIVSITASVAMSGGTTINFEASTDNTTFVAVQASNVGTNTIATTTITTGDWHVNVAGYSFLRARISAYSAGTITVVGWPVAVSDVPPIVNTNIVANTATNQSTNVAQLAGTTTDTNSGSKSAGTLRVVLATDQPALTNKLLVTPDSVALPANQSVNMAQVGGTNSVTGGVAGTLGVGGNVATNVAIGTNPINLGAQAVSAENTAVTATRMAQLVTDLVGKLIVLPYANPENFVSGAITSAMTGTTTTSLIAAPAAGLRNYITQITVSNSHATVGTDIIIQDGSGGTTLYTIPAAAAYGGATITFPVPLRQPTTATAIFCANVTTGSNTKVSASGYKGA